MKRFISAVTFSALTLGFMAPLAHATDAPAAAASQKPVLTGTQGSAHDPAVKATDAVKSAIGGESKAGEVKQDTAKPTAGSDKIVKPAS